MRSLDRTQLSGIRSWGVMVVVCLDIGVIAAVVIPPLIFSLQPGEWGPRPWYMVPIYYGVLALSPVSVVAFFLRKKWFVWPLLAIVGICAGREIYELAVVARDFSAHSIEGEVSGFNWIWGGGIALWWLAFALLNVFVLIGPFGIAFFSGKRVPD